jgi:sulfoxide reductase heme-binding subunit YedZ
MPPWNDRKGHLSVLKLGVFVALFVPGLWSAWQWWQGDLDPKPVTEALHLTGAWALRILLLSLAITPLRSIVHWPRLIDVRRMVGVGALAYLVIHFGLYIYDQKLDMVRVASEIVLRFYLTIGFVALVGIAALGVTSTDGWVQRMGALNWNRLHRTIYWLLIFSLAHAFLQSKVDVSEPVLNAGLFLALMGWRTLSKRGLRGPWALAGLASAASLATMLIEAAWYAGKTGVPWLRILAANVDPDMSVRPAQWVLIVVLALIPLRIIGQRRAPAPRKVLKARTA